MNASTSFVVRRAFLVPLGLLLLLILTLMAVCLVQEQPIGKVVILACIAVPVAGLFIESLFRKAIFSESEVRVKKFLRQSTIPFAEVTSLDLVAVRKRAFLSLSTEESFLILSNAYQDFPALVSLVLERVPEAAVTEETRQQCGSVPVKSADIFSCWLAVGLLLFILYIQFAR